MMSQREKFIGIILLALAVVCVFVFSSRHLPVSVSGGKTVQELKNGVATTKTPAQDSKDDFKRMVDKVMLQNQPKQASEPSDPFRKFELRDLVEGNILEFSELKLIGIVMDEEITAALINDEILYVGDEISGFKVTEIRANEVFLTRGLEKYTLKLFEEQ